MGKFEAGGAYRGGAYKKKRVRQRGAKINVLVLVMTSSHIFAHVVKISIFKRLWENEYIFSSFYYDKLVAPS